MIDAYMGNEKLEIFVKGQLVNGRIYCKWPKFHNSRYYDTSV